MSEDVKANVNERPIGHAPGHARHDRLLIVRYAADDLAGTDLEQARTQATQCTDCGRLAADTKGLQTSLAALPVPTRTRDFRLSPEKAEQLRGSPFDRFLRRLAMPNLGLLRPVAGVGVALGLVIAAVGGGVPAAELASTGAGAPAPAAIQVASMTPVERDMGVSAAPTSVAESGPGGAADYPSATTAAAVAPSDSAKAGHSDGTLSVSAAPTATQAFAIVPSAPASATEQPEAANPTTASATTDSGRLLIVYAGLTLAIVAFGLLLLSLYARRRNEDPLLR